LNKKYNSKTKEVLARNKPAGAIIGEVNINGETSRPMFCNFENLEWRLNYET
jgi:hypothetical protein